MTEENKNIKTDLPNEYDNSDSVHEEISQVMVDAGEAYETDQTDAASKIETLEESIARVVKEYSISEEELDIIRREIADTVSMANEFINSVTTAAGASQSGAFSNARTDVNLISQSGAFSDVSSDVHPMISRTDVRSNSQSDVHSMISRTDVRSNSQSDVHPMISRTDSRPISQTGIYSDPWSEIQPEMYTVEPNESEQDNSGVYIEKKKIPRYLADPDLDREAAGDEEIAAGIDELENILDGNELKAEELEARLEEIEIFEAVERVATAPAQDKIQPEETEIFETVEAEAFGKENSSSETDPASSKEKSRDIDTASAEIENETGENPAVSIWPVKRGLDWGDGTESTEEEKLYEQYCQQEERKDQEKRVQDFFEDHETYQLNEYDDIFERKEISSGEQLTYEEPPVKKKRKGSGLITMGIIVVAACIMAFALNKIITIRNEYKESDAAYEEVVEAAIDPEQTIKIDVPDTTDKTELPVIDFVSLIDLNQDIVGWVYFENPSIINYPITCGRDNEFYLTHTYTGAVSSSGSIFIEMSGTDEMTDNNVIMYGHNMNNGSMFAALTEYVDENFGKANPYFYIYTRDGGIYRYRAFAFYETTDVSPTYKLNFADEEEFATYLHDCRKNSQYSFGTEVSTDKPIMTLSTCTNRTEEGRYVLQGVMQKVIQKGENDISTIIWGEEQQESQEEVQEEVEE